MKRHHALETLSHDHQHALAVALALRRADAQTAPQAIAAFLAFWHAEGQAHFGVEEAILLPAYAVKGQPDHPLVIQMLADHMIIRRDAAGLDSSASLDTLHALGERLADHVRLEERQLFPLIEQVLSEVELGALGVTLHGHTP